MLIYLDLYHCLVILFSAFVFRYQVFLQVKQDLLQGRLPCPFNTAAQLGAYAIQCMCFCSNDIALLLSVLSAILF